MITKYRLCERLLYYNSLFVFMRFLPLKSKNFINTIDSFRVSMDFAFIYVSRSLSELQKIMMRKLKAKIPENLTAIEDFFI